MNSTRHVQIQNFMLFQSFQNLLITNGIGILLQVAAKSVEYRVSIRTVNCFFFFLDQSKVRIGTVNCPYSSGPNSVRTVLTLVSLVMSVSLLGYASTISLACQLTRLRVYQHTSLRVYAFTSFFQVYIRNGISILWDTDSQLSLQLGCEWDRTSLRAYQFSSLRAH